MSSILDKPEQLNLPKVEPPRIPPMVETLLERLGCVMVLASPSVPEQWEITRNGQPSGYIRARHGHMSVDYPEAGEEELADIAIDGFGGLTDHEREPRLLFAIGLIAARLLG